MKNNTNELNKTFKNLIDAVCPAVHYYTRKPEKYPYSVFESKQINELDGRAVSRLEIDIFSRDMFECQQMADELEKIFDHKYFLSGAVAFDSYTWQRLNIEEEDKQIYRIKLQIDYFSYKVED